MKDNEVSTETAVAARQYTAERLYWLEKLSGDLVKSSFPFDEAIPAPPAEGDGGPAVVSFEIPDPLVSTLIRISGGSDFRLHMILTAAVMVLLNKYTGHTDIIVGSPIDKQEIDGAFINTVLALRCGLEEDMSFKDLLMQVKQTIGEAGKHQNYPIETLPELLDIRAEADDGFPLFDVAVLLTNIQEISYIRRLDLNLVFSFSRTDAELGGVVEYNPRRYRKETVHRIAAHFPHLLRNLVIDVNARPADLDILLEDEKQRMLVDFNDTAAEYPREKTIHRLFEEQAAETPDNPAVIEAANGDMEDITLSYRQLNNKANQLAHRLMERGVEKDSIVCIMGQRKIEIMIGILAVLKAGGAYVPLDAKNPHDRNRLIIEDSGAVLFLTQKHLMERYLDAWEDRRADSFIALDDLSLYTGETDNPEVTMDSRSPAYVIFTSGTTGRPKGVVIEHRSAVNYLCWAAHTYVKDEILNFPVFTSISYDLTVTSIFVPWITGGAAVLYGGDYSESLIERIVDDNKVGVVKLTPSHMYLLADKVVENSNIRRLIAGGESLGTSIAARLFENFQGKIDIYNEYGPTEATVGCMIHRFDPQTDTAGAVPIGAPIANTRIYILDRNLRPVPIGAVGELYISGDALARGYLELPDQTAERFVEPDMSNETYRSSRIYKTGDLARRRPPAGGAANAPAGGAADAAGIDFLGRIDHQVKIRGHRVELDEIEARLSNHERIRAAVVITREMGIAPDADYQKSEIAVVAYYVADEHLPVHDLREYLEQSLPEYMIPAFFTLLEELPLTPVGKVDRRALPDPEVKSEAAYAPPRDELEEQMVNLWAELLGTGAENIGLDGNYFELGGHSLKATVLMAHIHKEFDVKLGLADIFRMPTVRQITEFVRGSVKEEFIPIGSLIEKPHYPVSPAQKRLFALQRIEGKNNLSYNIPLILEVHGTLSRRKLEDAFRKLILRHESLRTTFGMADGEPVQKVHDDAPLNLEYFETVETEVPGIIRAFIRTFNIARLPLMRTGLIKLSTERHILMVDMHHIISDGVSMDIVTRELPALYEGRELPALELHYKDYADWLTLEDVREMMAEQETYWVKRFSGDIPVLDLPVDYPRPLMQSFEGKRVFFEIDRTTAVALRNQTARADVTLFMMMLSLFQVLLGKLSGQDDIVVGTPIAGRRHPDVQDIIGIFINTLPLRGFPRYDKSFFDFLKQNKNITLKAYDNQEYPFDQLVGKVVEDRDAGRNPLLDVMLTFDNYQKDRAPAQVEGDDGALTFNFYEFEGTVSKFDLMLSVVEGEEDLYFSFEYCTRLFKPETIDRFIAYFKKIVAAVADNPRQNISDIEIVTEAEKKEILYDFNDTDADFPGDKTIHQLFTEQVEKDGGRTAVIDGGPGASASLTYDQLNQKSIQLAARLREKGVGADSIAAVMVERSMEMMVGVYGVLAAGGAYLPIDPGYPEDRIRYMLEDSGASVVLTRHDAAPALNEWGDGVEVIYLDGYTGAESPLHAPRPMLHAGEARGLAYVIYTSGSTGRPKGVMIEHRALVNRLHWMQKQYPIDHTDTILHKTPFTFDVSVWEICWWAVVGAKVCLSAPGGEKDPALLMDAVETHDVTVMHFVPSMLNAFLEYVEKSLDTKRLASLKQVIASGEALTVTQVLRFNRTLSRDNGTRLANLYGPTEAAIDVSYYDCPAGETIDRVPIGRPIDNIRLLVMNEALRLQPVGVAGELHIAGAGLARGYLNNPELTADRFLEPDTSNESHKSYRTYKTGDLVRWLPNADIEFLGRLDHQVKIRGFRIELGEIENRLAEHETVKEAVVIAAAVDGSGAGEKSLCAYFVPGGDVDIAALKRFLAQTLPAYMIPAYFVPMEEIPLTPSGKTDRKRLPAARVDTGGEYAAPADDIQEKLLDTWADVLKLPADDIGVDKNFFELGGDSINAIQVSARLLKSGLKLETKDLFLFPRIKDLSKCVVKMTREIDQGPVTGEVRLTPIQTAFFEHYKTGIHHYNLAVMLSREDRIDQKIVENVFTRIVEHHDALRMVFEPADGGSVMQTNRGPGEQPFHLEVKDLPGGGDLAERLEKEARAVQERFDPARGPLVSLGLYHTPAGSRLAVAIHHLVMDGVSLQIILEDFILGYQSAVSGRPVVFQDKTDSYRTWADKLSAYAGTGDALRERDYWTGLENTAVPSLPGDHEVRPEDDRRKNNRTVRVVLDPADTEALLKEADKAYNTEINDLLLTALSAAFKEWKGADTLLVSMEGHGRESIIRDVEISRTVGWFTSRYPVVLDITAVPDTGGRIKQVKETLRRIPNKGIGYGVLRYLSPPPETDAPGLAREPEISFNYLGHFDGVSGAAGGDFSVSGVSAGDSISPETENRYHLNITGVVGGGRLTLSFEYNRLRYDDHTVDALAQAYKTNMETVIRHCVEKEDTEITLSDLSTGKLEEEEMEAIFDDFE